jgi:hypothetical protein
MVAFRALLLIAMQPAQTGDAAPMLLVHSGVSVAVEAVRPEIENPTSPCPLTGTV